MDFSLSPDQLLFKKTLNDLFKNEYDKRRLRERSGKENLFNRSIWSLLHHQGILGTCIPKQYGGTGGDFLDLMLVMEAIGKHIVLSPFYCTCGLAAQAIQHFGNDEQKKVLLSSITNDETIISFALLEGDCSYNPSKILFRADFQGDRYILNGSKLFVPYAKVANQFIVFARTEESKGREQGLTAFVVDNNTDGISIETIPTTAQNMRCEVDCKNTEIPKHNILGKPGKGWGIAEFVIQRAAILKSAEMLGGSQEVFNRTVKFVKKRKQFDQAIGAFQVIQHKLVDFFTDISGLRNMVYKVAWQVAEGRANKSLISQVKAKANRVYHNICHHGLFFHGSSGLSEQADIGLYHLRSRALIHEGGSTEYHMEKIANELENYKPRFLAIRDSMPLT